MTEIKVFKDNEKMDEAHSKVVNFFDNLVNEYQLTYYEVYGLLEAYKFDLYDSLSWEDDEE